MQYRADILSLYRELFDETHAALEKNAGVWDFIKSPIKYLKERPTRNISDALSRVLKTEGVPYKHRAAPEQLLRSPELREMTADPKVLQQLQQEVPHVFSPYSTHPLGQQWQQIHRGHQAERLAQEEVAKAEAARKKALGPSPATIAATTAAVGIPAAGLGGYLLGRPNAQEEEAKRVRTRNIAFGAGAATGLAAPYVIRGLGSIANRIGGGNQGFMPEGYGY